MVDIQSVMEAYDPQAAMVALGRGIRRRGNTFAFWPVIPPFVCERVGREPVSTDACAA